MYWNSFHVLWQLKSCRKSNLRGRRRGTKVSWLIWSFFFWEWTGSRDKLRNICSAYRSILTHLALLVIFQLFYGMESFLRDGKIRPKFTRENFHSWFHCLSTSIEQIRKISIQFDQFDLHRIPNYLLFQRSIVRYLILNRGSTCIFYLLLDMHTIYFKLRKGYEINGGKLILQRGGRVEFRNGKFGNHWRARCIRAR